MGGREALADRRAARVHHRGAPTLHGLRLAPERLALEELAVPVERLLCRPQPPDQGEPLRGVVVTAVVLAPPRAGHPELLPEPPAHEIEHAAATPDVSSRG